MTVTVQDPFNEHTANGVTTAFAFEFRLISAAHLVATVDGETIPDSDYTVEGVGEEAGGTVTFDTAPADGATVLLKREVPLERSTTYTTNGPFPANTVNQDFDLIWMVMQKLGADYAGVVRAPFPETMDEMPSSTSRASKYLVFDADGNPSASEGTGADAGLRADLAAASGADLVGFAQAGTGAVARTAQAKAREVEVSAVDFGAVGDGSTHPLSEFYSTLAEAQEEYPHAESLDDEIDWAAAQAAANYVGGLGGGTVTLRKLGPSSYYVFGDQPLKLPDGVTLDGKGHIYTTAGGEHIVSTAAAGIVTKNGYDDTDNSRSVGVKNLKIKMQTAGAEGVVIAAAKRCFTENVVVVLQAANQVGGRMLAEKGSRSYGGNFYNRVALHVINNGGGAGCVALKLTGILNDGQNNANDFWIHQEACDKGIVCGPSLSNNFWGPSLEDNTTCAIQFEADAVRNTVWGAHVEGTAGTTVAVFDSGSSANRVFVESYTTAMTLMASSGSNNQVVYDNVIYSGAATKHQRYRRPTDTEDVLVEGPKGIYHGDGSTADPTTANSVGRRWSLLLTTIVTHTLSSASPSVTPDCDNGYDNYINMQAGTSGTVTINAPTNSFSDGEAVRFEVINNSGGSVSLSWNANYIRNASLPTSLTNGQRYTVQFRRRSTNWVMFGSFGPA